ncbi:hypothetical protein AO070_17190 [Pseudomonas syringae pv. syringae PD2766]|uniref:hypothetical protein n=1 Tax=Pseudomonas syringae TaxID=317 RepID=UPI000736F308|nr:hypothetical protein [Pseudomonas syringae]KTB77303.1 hypothetical protein AO070_17190 [Pseudomonas syringae pv. syringae PD2766]
MYTAHARQVLVDVEFVREKLEHETSMLEWRLNWVTAVVLIRAVGHILNKVDGKAFPAVRKLANELHQEWKAGGASDEIFKNFIEEERNNIIKEYEFGVSEGPVPIVAVMQDSVTGEFFEQRAVIDENIYRPMRGGFYEGEDGRTLLDDSITWWKKQLDRIDDEVKG